MFESPKPFPQSGQTQSPVDPMETPHHGKRPWSRPELVKLQPGSAEFKRAKVAFELIRTSKGKGPARGDR